MRLLLSTAHCAGRFGFPAKQAVGGSSLGFHTGYVYIMTTFGIERDELKVEVETLAAHAAFIRWEDGLGALLKASFELFGGSACNI